MTHENFEKILERRIQKTREVLSLKAKEYAQANDRLHNFKRSSQFMTNTLPSEVAWGYAMKHLMSVIDIVEGSIPATHEFVDEKIGDLINYLILLEACLIEERKPDNASQYRVSIYGN